MSVSTNEIWTRMPRDLTDAVCVQMATAMRIGGFTQPAINGMGVHILQLLEEVRGGDTGPLTSAQKCEFQIKVWEWCIHTAREGMAR